MVEQNIVNSHVNVGQFSLGQDIVDVLGWEATAGGQLRSRGYSYAVLSHQP